MRGLRVPLVGTIAMDAVMADVTDVPGPPVTVDDEFVLLGRQGDEEISAADLARLGTTISWEVLAEHGSADSPGVLCRGGTCGAANAHRRARPVDGARTPNGARVRRPPPSAAGRTAADPRDTETNAPHAHGCLWLVRR